LGGHVSASRERFRNQGGDGVPRELRGEKVEGGGLRPTELERCRLWVSKGKLKGVGGGVWEKWSLKLGGGKKSERKEVITQWGVEHHLGRGGATRKAWEEEGICRGSTDSYGSSGNSREKNLFKTIG